MLVVYGLDVSPGTFFAGTAFDETSITLKACGGGGVAVVYYIQDEPTPKIGGALPLPSKQNGEDVL